MALATLVRTSYSFLFLPLLLSLLFLLPSFAQADITTGLIGHWTFDNTLADSAGSNHGTLVGSPFYIENGQINQALSFNGADDAVNVDSASALDDLGPVTYSFWINSTSLSDGDRLFSKSSASTIGTEIRIDSNNRFRLQVNHGTSASNDLLRITANNTLTTNSWQHVVVTWDGSMTATNVRIYVDGVEAGYSYSQNGVGVRTSDMFRDFRIGNSGGGTGGFHGLIDDVRVYSAVLTTQQIQDLYNQGSASPTITTNKTTYAPGETITATITGGLFGLQEWAGVWVSTNPDASLSFESNWQYFNGTQTQPITPPTYPVVLSFIAPSISGTYNMRYFRENSVANKLAQSGNLIVSGGSPLPTVTLSASPSSIISGNSATLSWSSTNATSCSWANGLSGGASTNGSQQVSPTVTTTYTLSCIGIGGTGQNSTTVTVSSGSDITPPSTPTLNTPTVVSSSQINLSWTTSSDPQSGVANYELYRCNRTTTPSCTPNVLIASPAGTSFNNTTGLSPNTTYAYHVRAINGASLPSSYSNITQATTPTAPPVDNCTHYASPTGGGSGLAQSSPFQIANFWSVASPGDTLCLLDGTYLGTNAMIVPSIGLSGTSGNPITIRALNDGGVLLNGQSARTPIQLNGNNWFIIEGINVCCSSFSVVNTYQSDNVVVRRVVAWNANINANASIFSPSGNSNNLFEDVAGFGSGRKTFGFINTTGTTYRRAWGEWNGISFVGPKMVFAPVYHSYQARIENGIGTWNRIVGTDVSSAYGIAASDRLDDDEIRQTNSKILGSIFYSHPTSVFHPSRQVFLTKIDAFEIDNVVSFFHPGTNSSKNTFGLFDCSQLHTSQVDCVNPDLNIRNSTSIGGAGPFIASDWTQTNVRTFTNASQMSAGSIYTNATNGAQVCKRYVAGVLTSEPLWPWPMNQRIIDAMVQAGRSPVDVTATIESMFGTIPAECRSDSGNPIPGDLNSDGSVNTLDWGIMNLQWFTSDPTADLNSDGLVNSIDFGIMNSNWT